MRSHLLIAARVANRAAEVGFTVGVGGPARRCGDLFSCRVFDKGFHLHIIMWHPPRTMTLTDSPCTCLLRASATWLLLRNFRTTFSKCRHEYGVLTAPTSPRIHRVRPPCQQYHVVVVVHPRKSCCPMIRRIRRDRHPYCSALFEHVHRDRPDL